MDEIPTSVAGENKERLTPGGNSYDTIQAANATNAPGVKIPVGFGGVPEAQNNSKAETQKASFEKVVQELHKEAPIQNLRTYESDLADMVKTEHVSKVSIAAQKIQQPQPNQNALEETGPSVFGKMSMIIGTSLLILGSLGILIFIFIEIRPAARVVTQPITEPTAIISVNSVKTVSVGSGQTTLSAFLNAAGAIDSSGTSDGSIIQIVPEAQGTTSPLDPETFLADSGAKNLQNWFIRSLGPSYLIGFYNDHSSWKPFMIFQVLSYDNAFAGMLNWENGMGNDLAAFYGEAVQPISETTIATSSSTQPGPAGTKNATSTLSSPVIATSPPTFRDTVIDNENVRAFGEFGQTPLLYYSFPTQSILVITPSQDALQEIFKRLTSTQFIR